MKGLCRKLAALGIAFSMCIQGAAVSAFEDPAYAYAEFNKGGSDSQTETSNDDTSEENTEQSDIVEDDTYEEPVEEEVTEPEPEPAPAENTDDEKTDDKDKKVKKPATEITIYSYKSTVSVGDTFKIGYRLKPSKSDDVVTFSTSSKKIATVDSKGNVTSVAKGSAIITAKTSSGVKDKIYLTVKEAEIGRAHV